MPPNDASPDDALFGSVCSWVSLPDALRHFAIYDGKTQSQHHIKPLHWYVACRLVLEGGFRPEEVTPHPPFEIRKTEPFPVLCYNPRLATGGERTVLGGLKTKTVDVVVTKDGLGPVLAVSCKGAIGAYRNLTNRMEEAVGDCTNLHITYPAMVCGYMFVMRANRDDGSMAATRGGVPEEESGRDLKPNDIAISEEGGPVETIQRFHTALRELTGRRGIREDVSRYEAVALTLVESTRHQAGDVLQGFPQQDSPLRLDRFFDDLLLRYDERYVYSAPDLKGVTRRLEWSASSPVFESHAFDPSALPSMDFEPRIGME